jgi:hypothetical protein
VGVNLNLFSDLLLDCHVICLKEYYLGNNNEYRVAKGIVAKGKVANEKGPKENSSRKSRRVTKSHVLIVLN